MSQYHNKNINYLYSKPNPAIIIPIIRPDNVYVKRNNDILFLNVPLNIMMIINNLYINPYIELISYVFPYITIMEITFTKMNTT